VKRLSDDLLYRKGSATFSRYRQALNEKLEYLKGSEGSQALNPFIISALHDAEADVRSNAAQSLAQLAQASPEVFVVLLEALSQAKDISVRRDIARLLGQVGQSDEQTIQALWKGLLDENYELRTACAEGLAQLGQRFSTAAETIEKKFIQAIEDPTFDKPDSDIRRSGREYAYDGLWLLVVGGELQ